MISGLAGGLTTKWLGEIISCNFLSFFISTGNIADKAFFLFLGKVFRKLNELNYETVVIVNQCNLLEKYIG